MTQIKGKVLKTILFAVLPLAVLAVLIFSQSNSTQATGEVAIWHFDENAGTAAVDSAGSNNGILTNFQFDSTDGWTAGKIGNALQFDGVNDYLSLNTISDITFSKSYSVSLWAKINDTSSAQNLFTHTLSSTDRAGIYISGGVIRAGTRDGTADTGASGNISLGWNHIVFVHQAGGANYLYLNAVNQTGTNTPNTYSMVVFTLGSANTSSYFNGLIDEVKIFNHALTTDEVLADYSGGSPTPTPSATPTPTPTVGLF